MKAMLRTANHVHVSTLGRPRSGVGKAQHTGIKLAANNGLDQVGTRLELHHFDIQAMLFVKAAFVGGDSLCVIHDAQITNLELIGGERSEEHTSELQSLMRNSYAVFCLKKKKVNTRQ